jgi:uncharacterized protein DUF6328
LTSGTQRGAPQSPVPPAAQGGKVLTGAHVIAAAEPLPERDESPLERLDRNTGELVQGLRVAGTGIQVLFAFLLILPFNARFTRLNSFERGVYMVTLICIAIATVLLIAPSIHHRLLFRRGQKKFLVDTGNRLMILASLFMSVGLTGAVLLISEFVIGGAAALVIAICGAVMIICLWFAVPLNRRRQLGNSAEQR